MSVECRADRINEGIATAVRLQILDEEEHRLATSISAVRSVDLGAPADEHDPGLSLGDDPANSASEVVEREVGFGMLEELEANLREVAAARRRVIAGTYGVCAACGDRVTLERLEALPATRWCVRCADHQERLRRGPSGPDVITRRR